MPVRDETGRGLVGVDTDGQPQIRSRRGTDLTRAFPIAGPAAEQLPAGTLLDGELVVWTGTELDFGQLQRRLMSPGRAATLARTRPASYMIFDVLQLRGEVLTGEPLRTRRRRLEGLLPALVPPLQLTPATRDRAVAQRWLDDYAAAGVGIEGLVIKGLAENYHPGHRRWLKLRNRTSVEAIVGAISGALTAPDRLILALPAADGSLVVAGGTGPLTTAQQRDVSAFLQLPVTEHPWSAEVPTGLLGAWGGKDRQPVTRVEPSLVVEIEADAAYEGPLPAHHPAASHAPGPDSRRGQPALRELSTPPRQGRIDPASVGSHRELGTHVNIVRWMAGGLVRPLAVKCESPLRQQRALSPSACPRE